MTGSDTSGVPPEISADELFGIPKASEMYECPGCGARFVTLERLQDHYIEEGPYHDD
jgi:hypothetical protein